VSGHSHVVLVGLMGTGKTTVGAMLAEHLRRPFCDTDAVVEARHGRTVREIWESDGEPAYRVLETSVLLDALRDPNPLVVAAAGGVVLAAENRAALRQPGCVVVWLTADPAVLVARARSGGHRPLLDDDPAGAMARMAVDREALYREVADVTVRVDELSADEVCDAVLDALYDWGIS
jgi:shikimate kinase